MRVYPEILGESLYTGHYLLGPDTYRYDDEQRLVAPVGHGDVLVGRLDQ